MSAQVAISKIKPTDLDALNLYGSRSTDAALTLKVGKPPGEPAN